MRFLVFLLFISSAFAECKPVSEPLKLTPFKGLIVKLNDTPFHLQGLMFLKTEDYAQAVTWLNEVEVVRHGTLQGVNRYGAETAMLFSGDDLISASLLRVGIAIYDGKGICSEVLKQAESEARLHKRGVWATIISTNDPLLNDYVGRFTLVRGTVLSARKARSGVYINFSRDFKTSLSGYIFERDVGKIDWQSLSGKNVILKGVISKMQGIQMIISEQSQIIVE